MLWLETITVRLAGKERRVLLADLSPQLDRLTQEGLSAVRIYSHAQLPTDCCVHLFWQAPAAAGQKSTSGLQLAAGLAGAGLVQHVLWREEVKK